MLRDSRDGYGVVSRVFHWGYALAFFALFALGWWMVELDYYSPYYNSAPYWHKATGVVFLILLVPRFMWRLANSKPSAGELSPFERRASSLVHWGFYPLLLALLVTGYLIPTADGQPIDVFGWFSAPAIVTGDGLETRSGWWHWLLAWIALVLALVHSVAALKHHIIDKSTVLTRMWSGPPRH